jgi:hypothetical protein
VTRLPNDAQQLIRARQRIANLESERDVLRAALSQAQPIVCGALCPSVKRTGDEWEHVALCRATTAALENEL